MNGPALARPASARRFGDRAMFRDVSFSRRTRRGVRHPRRLRAPASPRCCGRRSGLLPPDRGTRRSARPRHVPGDRGDVLRQIGVMFQSGALFGSMTLLENVMLPLQMYTGPAAARGSEQVARVKLGLVGLGDASRAAAGRDLRRHGQARRHRPRPSARPAAAVPRRAVRGPRPDHLGGSGPAHPRPAPRSRHDLRRGHPRTRFDPRHRGPLHHARPGARRASSRRAIRAS